jgi:hypothetical protein
MAKEKRVRPSLSLQAENSWFERLSPFKQDLVCIVAIYVILLVVFNKIVFDDMLFAEAGDTAAAQSWTKAIEYIAEKEHEEPLWVPYIFSGLPVSAALHFPREVNYIGAVLLFIGKILFLNAELSWFIMHYFLGGLFVYLLVRYLKFSPFPALIAALTFMLNPYAIGLGQAGHGSKLMTLSYIPLLFFATHYLFEKRNLLGTGFLSIATGLLFLSKHPQIAFYGLLIVSLYTLYEVVLDVKLQPMVCVKKILLLTVALALGFGIYAYQFLPIQEYSHYSIRGGGEGNGLSYDYATNWSFHPFEMLNYFIPSFFGYASPYYWGWMPFTDSTVYVGMVPMVLSILALLYRRNRMTWFFVAVSVFMLLISFGKHFGVVYNLMFDYMPYFNKFRVPVMILHLMPFTLGILTIYGYSVIIDAQTKSAVLQREVLLKKMTKVLIAVGVVLAISFIGKGFLQDFFSSFMFEKEGEIQELRQQYGAQAGQVIEHLRQNRFELLWKDVLKFCIIGGAVISVVVLYLRQKIKSFLFSTALLVILIVDLSIINVRYIQPVPQTNTDSHFYADETIQVLKNESETGLFRVYPVGSLFQDNFLMYHHIASVGGYSPAKFKIYQEVIDSCFRQGNMNVFNMLNVKYFLMEQESQGGKRMVVQENPGVLPRAWFVDSIVVANNAAEVFQMLNSPNFEPQRFAILEKNPSTTPQKSDSVSVRIVSYKAHSITLETYCEETSVLVLSEVYYPVGWRAFIDGIGTEIHKTNYILRSVVVPEGSHTVEFRFEPKSYEMGYLISNASWAIALLLWIVGLIKEQSVKRWIEQLR